MVALLGGRSKRGSSLVLACLILSGPIFPLGERIRRYKSPLSEGLLPFSMIWQYYGNVLAGVPAREVVPS